MLRLFIFLRSSYSNLFNPIGSTINSQLDINYQYSGMRAQKGVKKTSLQYYEIINPCSKKSEFCRNCNSQFMMIRPLIKSAIIHKNFYRDLGKDKERVDFIVKLILDCTNIEFHELHKFEKIVAGNLVFRAKREGVHFIYSVNKSKIDNLLFLRAMSNFTKYKRLLANDQQLKRMITNLIT